MARKCPVCGSTFPNFAKVCDQHGVPLVAAGRPLKVYLAAALGAAALLAATPFAASLYWASCLTVKIQEVQIEKTKPGTVSDNKDLSHWLADKTLNVRLSVHNGSRLPVGLDGASYKVIVASVEALKAETKGSVNLAPGTTQQLDWKISLSDASLRQLLLHPPADGILTEVIATVELRVTGFAWTAPLRQKVLIKPALKL
jgi:hypothetical protein